MKSIYLIHRMLPWLILCATSFSATGLAQTPGVVIKGKAPVNNKPLKVTLPKAYQTKLSNGIELIVLENHKLPTFSMQMVILSGGFSDPAGQEGVARYVATMLTEGTKTRTSRQIAESIESLGASLSASASLSSLTTSVSASGLTDQFDQIMELFSDVILNPSFPKEEFEKLKTRGVAQLRYQRSQPDFLAAEMFNKVMYGSHPGGRYSLTEAQIRSFTPEMLKTYHATHYRPNNAIFAIVGDVKPAEIVARLEKTFGGWRQGEIAKTEIPKVADTGASRIHLIDRPGSMQTNLILGTQTIERNDPDYYALNMMNQIIGGGASARLFLNLREDKGYTYGAYSGLSANKYRGTFRAQAEVRTEVTKASMDELMYEFKRIRDEKAPQDEFDRAKRTIVGSFALQLESPQSLLGNIVQQKIYGLPADYWDAYPEKISAITEDDVQRVARKYLDLGKIQIVAVGDAGKIAAELKPFGPVGVFDTEGKPAEAKPAAPATPTGGGNLASLAGSWNLSVNTPDGLISIKMDLKPNGAEIGGQLETPFGPLVVTGASLAGADLSVKAKGDIQGNPVEVQISAKIDGDSMKGQIIAAGFPTVDFTAKRESK